MSDFDPSHMTRDQVVDHFAHNGIAQAAALLYDELDGFNRRYPKAISTRKKLGRAPPCWNSGVYRFGGVKAVIAKLALLSIEQLIAEFATIGIAQDEALLEGSTRKFNRLYGSKTAILNELKSRDDARYELVRLYDHPNMQVQLNAANATLAVAPKEARQVLEDIRASRCYPQAMDAGMCIRGLDDGTSLPA